MVTRTRVGRGRWAYAGAGDSEGGERVEQLDELLRSRSGEAAVDESLCYPIMGQPGELLTRHERIADTDGGELEAVGWNDISFAIACVPSARRSSSRGCWRFTTPRTRLRNSNARS